MSPSIMTPGCFPRWPGRRKSTRPADSDKITDAKRPKEVSATPTAGDYALEASAQGIKYLKAAVNVVGGVPGAQGVLDIALVLIQTCQDLTEIEEKVSELKNDIERLTLTMVKAVEGREHASIPQDLLRDIENLKTDLEKVKQDLDKIAAQNRLLVILFKNANKAKIERCMNIVKNSLQHWDVSRDISHSLVLHQMEQKVDRVQETVGAMQTSLGGLIRQAHTASHASSRQMPPKPSIFYGRDVFVDEIAKILVNASESSKAPRICIHGTGGMGKTSAAIAVMEHPDVQKTFSESNRFWVPCVCATSPDILLHILYANLRISRDTGDFLADIVAELQSSSSPRLMLLDNFETPWDPIEGKREDVEKIFHSLSAVSQLSILVTMRTNIPPSEQIDWIDKPLGTVDPETSRNIYCAIHPRAAGKPKLSELLAELGYMPFAITLVATLGKRSKAMPESLLKDWRRHGPGMLSSDEAAEDSISISIGLSMNSKTMLKNDSARILLATLSLLPAGTTHSHLDWWAPDLGSKRKNAAISALSNVALIVDAELDDGEVSISVLPVVQSYMHHGGRIPPIVRDTVRRACRKLVLDHKPSLGDPMFRANLLTIASEETNIQSILLGATRNLDDAVTMPDIQRLLDVLLAFSWYHHWSKPRTEVVEHTLKLARKAQLEQYIAESLFCLGSTLFRLDRYEDACQCFIEARDRFKTLSATERATHCAFELVELYIYMHRDDDVHATLNSISEEDLGPHGHLRARASMTRGLYLWYMQERPEALESLAAARDAFDSEEDKRPYDVARCYLFTSYTLGRMQNFTDALDAISESLKIFEKFGPDNQVVESLVYKDAILIRMGAQDDETFSTLQLSLQKAQELGLPLCISQALELFGEFHVRQGNKSSALEYFKAAEVQYKTISDSSLGAAGLGRCRYNCQLLEDDLVTPDWDHLASLSQILC